MVFDIAARSVVHRSRLDFGVPRETALAGHGDGFIYGLTDECIYRVDPDSFAVEQVAVAPVAIYCGWAMTEKGIYFGSGVDLWRYNW